MVPSVRNFSQGWLPSAFNDFFDTDWMAKVNATAPSMNVIEDDKSFKVEVAAPGMTKDDFKIRVDDNGDLVLKMEKQVRNDEKDKGGKKYLRREFSYTKFEQAFTLPDNVERDKISASVKDGILNIELPKQTQEEKSAKRYIDVQ